MGVSGRHVDHSIRTDEVMYFVTDKVAPNITYFGRTESFDSSDSDAVWQIKRIEKTGTVERVRYANSGKYNCKWSERSTYFPTEPTQEPVVDDITQDAAKIIYSYDVNGNIIRIDYYTGVNNRVNVTFPGVSISGEYWLFENVSGSSKYYVWYRIDGIGVDPSIAGRTGIMVSCASTLAAITAATISAVNASGANTFGYAKLVDSDTIAFSHKEYGVPVQPTSPTLGVTAVKQGTVLDLSKITYLSYNVDDDITDQIRVEP